MSPVVYWHTRTAFEFQVAVLAWVQTYAFPARMLLPGRRDGGGTTPGGRTSFGRRAEGRRFDGNYDRLIGIARSKGTPLRGTVRENIVDLRKVMPTNRALTPEERHRLMLTMGRRATKQGPLPAPMARTP